MVIPIYTEEELVCLIKNGNRDVFNYIFVTYGPGLMFVIHRLTDEAAVSEQLFQEAFVSIWQNIDTYDAEEENLYIWMRNITKNVATTFIHSGSRV